MHHELGGTCNIYRIIEFVNIPGQKAQGI